jgi:hypothetical protein
VDWARPVAAISAPPASVERDAFPERQELVLAAGLPVETFRASRAAAVRDAPSAQGGTAVAPDALVAQAQLLAASELYLVVERQARIRRCLVEPAPDRLPVHDGSNALSV